MLVLTSGDVWAPTRELALSRYPLRSGWALVRSYAAGTAWGLTESTSERSRWSVAGGAGRHAQTRTGTPRAGRDGSLRRERESPTEQTRFC